MTVAAWLELTPVAVAVNVFEVEPEGTVTEEGTLRLVLLLLRVTAVPPAGAAALRVTVHVDVPGVAKEAGLHVTELRLVLVPGVTVIVLPVPVMATFDPVGSVPMVLVRPAVVVPAVGANVRFTVATTPFPMAVPFVPLPKHVYVPEDPVQYRDLDAAVRAGPAVMLTAVTADAGYVSVHSKPASWLEVLSDRLRAAVPPATAEPLDNVKDPVCPNSETFQRENVSKAKLNPDMEELRRIVSVPG